MKNTSTLALLLTLAACGPTNETTVAVADSPAGPVSCHIICRYEEDFIELRAEVSPCVEGEACATCDSCRGLLEYHAAEFSCLTEGNQNPIIITPITGEECAQ